MANLPSLAFSGSKKSTKISRAPQLPLPSTNPALSVSSSSNVELTRVRPVSSVTGQTDNPLLPINSALPSTTSPRLRNVPLSADTTRAVSPTFSNFQQPFVSGGTHASGILPSMSFFRPSKPSDISIDGPTLEDNRIPDEERGFQTGSTMGTFPTTPPEVPPMGSPRSPRSLGPSFNPVPPNRRPPLSALPLVNPKSSKPVRRYQKHTSQNTFFCGGRLITGGDKPPWAFIGSSLVVGAIAGLWFGTTAVWWSRNESPAVAAIGAYLCLITIASMYVTAFQDPGILPRYLDPDPPTAGSPSEAGARAPLPRDLRVRSDVCRVKYCPTCRIYRPPRCSHCKMCDNCVDDCDHHCQWINNCVGRRNYTTFIVFLTAATITLILILVTSALQIAILARRDKGGIQKALEKNVGTAIVFCLSLAVFWPIIALLSYHVRLLLLNVTTIEQLRNQAHKTIVPDHRPQNPFSHGSWRRNCLIVLCRPQGFSWLNARGISVEDQREINPGNKYWSGSKDREDA